MKDPVDPITDVDDVNKNIGKNIYLLIIDEVLIASTRKADLNRYLGDDKALIDIDNYDPEETLLLYGLVLNPVELPYELPKELQENDLWLIKNQSRGSLMGLVVCEKCEDMADVTELIELEIKNDADLNIEDFAVVVGQRMDLVLQIGPRAFLVETKHLF